MRVITRTVSKSYNDSKSQRLLTTIELRIHKYTERGDNNTVKMPNGQTVVIDGKTCADR